MESLGPGELRHGITQTCFFIKVRLASYLEIRLLGLIMTVRPYPDMVKIKYGISTLYEVGRLKYGIPRTFSGNLF